MDRVTQLSGDGSRRKRKAMPEDAQDKQHRQQSLDAKAAIGKVQRSDTETVDEQFTTGTQDSVQTAFNSCQALVQHQQQVHQLQQHTQPQVPEDVDVGSGSEVDGPFNDKYIKGTRLVIGGWFQACRGCNEPTAHSAYICKREVPLCPRCQSQYMAMVTGCYPPTTSAVADPAVEPLHFWLPCLLAPVPRLSDEQRREFCDRLVLRQDDAWLQLISMS